MERNLTSGSVFKNIVIFSLPYLLSYFLQTLYGLADLFIIGQFEGVASTTAVSVGSQVMHMLTVMIVGLAMGSTVSIGQAVGARDRKRAALAIGNTATLFMTLSVVLTVVLLILVRQIVAVISTPAEAVEGTVAYLTICFIGIPLITAYNIISSVFRGMGDSKSPMYFIAVACAANITLDYLFMGALKMGPAGAALGTTLAQAISVAVSLVMVLRQKTGIALRREDLKPNRDMMGQLLSIGVPIAIQDGLIQVAFIIITIIANRRGLTDAAAVGIVEKFISFVFLVPSSMLSTVSALGAQNIGANKPERAVATLRYAVMIAAGFGVIVTILIQFIAESIVGLFTPDAAVICRRRAVPARIYFRLHLRRDSLQLQRIFLRLRKVRAVVHAQHHRRRARARSGRVFHLQALPATLLPMGLATAAGSLVSVIICVIAFAVISRRGKAAAAEG